MAEYYTKAEADLLFAPYSHDHVLEALGGTELPATRVAVPETVSPSFGDAFTLDEALDSIATQMAGKAPASHTHTGYAPASHTHSDYATADHGHTPAAIGAAPASHTHDYAAPAHSHTQSEITGLADALAAKANASAMSSKADLVDGKVPAAQLPSFVDDVVDAHIVNGATALSAGWLAASADGTAFTPESGKVYIVVTAGTYYGKTYRWSGTVYAPIGSDLALGETSGTAYRGDRGKTAYDHSQNAEVHVTAAQKNSWNSKADGNHTHAPAAIGAAAASHSHSYNDLSDKPTIPTSLPANGGDADTVDGKHATDFAEASHTHTLSAITGLMSMLLTDSAGRQKLTITGDVLATIAGLAAGVHTCYSAGGDSRTATNAPNNIESWRYLIHKNYAEYGWVMAFGSEGSFFLNYYDGGVWRGWKPIWDNNPVALWTGTLFMNANQTVTPSKKLSQCKNGWILLWSDYDTANSAATNGDVFATYVPKRCYSGGNWSGHSWLFDIPIEASASAESRCIKKMYIWDNRIVGNAINEANSRNDVVLRAVYEW